MKKIVIGFDELVSFIKQEYQEGGMGSVISVNTASHLKEFACKNKTITAIIILILFHFMCAQVYEMGYSFGKVLYYLMN